MNNTIALISPAIKILLTMIVELMSILYSRKLFLVI